MKAKKIANIVFYKYYGSVNETKKACIFYTDGTVKDCSYDEGIDAVLEVVKQRNITSKEQLLEIINKDVVYVMSGYDFEDNFHKFIVKTDAVNTSNNSKVIPKVTEDTSKKEERKSQESQEDVAALLDDDKDEEELVTPVAVKNTRRKGRKQSKISKFISNRKSNREKSKLNKEKKPSKVRKFFKKIKSRVLPILLGATVILGSGYVAGKNESKIRKFFNNVSEKFSPNTNKVDDNNLLYGNNDYYNDYTYKQLLKVNNNEVQKQAMKNVRSALVNFNVNFANAHLENGKDIKAALNFTEVNALQQAYNNYSNDDIAAIFNGSRINANEFGQAYKNANLQLMGAHVIETRQAPVDMSMLINSEEGKEFYNRYHEMFLQIKEATGQDKIDKINAWRQAIAQDLPISDDVREVGISHADNRIVDSYKLSIVPMVSAVEIMYQNLAVDNTLSTKTIDYLNDVGLCNLAQDTFDRIERVTEVAHENNEEPLYEQYENAIITRLMEKDSYVIDDAHRDLSQLDAFQEAVNKHNHNGIQNSYSNSTGSVLETHSTVDSTTITTMHTSKEKETTKTSDRDKAIEKAGKQKVEKAEEKVDKEIAKDNAIEKQKAEQEAEQKRQELQAEADKQAEQMKEQVENDYKDFMNDLDSANSQIDKNNADNDTTNDHLVNESDFGDHNVDFFDDYSDSNGYLDNSVEDLTTDSSNDMTNQPLPDPNATGSAFENSYPETSEDLFPSNSSYTVPEYDYDYNLDYGYTEDYGQDEYYEPTVDDSYQSVFEYEEPVEETPDEYASISNEELVNMLVENMANESDSGYTEGYQYTLH